VNPDLERLQPYPFERLAALLAGVDAPADRAVHRLSVGEPQHAPPRIVEEALRSSLDLLSRYPSTRGDASLRESQAAWLRRRHGLRGIDAEQHLLPVNGTREALFAIAQASVARGSLVGCPNPFYQIYEGAALLAGADVVFLDTRPENGFLPDPDSLSNTQWQAMDLLYLCSPGNPSGAIMDRGLFTRFIERALEHDVLLVSDECYSELYVDEAAPPAGLLAACEAAGNLSYRNCLSMHSLSKRSNLPGLRSGFVAGDADTIRRFQRYRSYHGCAMPPHHQVASTVAWNDEDHVIENRARYRHKFAAVIPILKPVLDFPEPAGGFYLWARIDGDDQVFTRELYRDAGVLVLPGTYLGRDAGAGNPGAGRLRMALVASRDDCVDAARRIRAFIEGTHRC
jgi:N-succinyldiaminopimelate aminotransferase